MRVFVTCILYLTFSASSVPAQNPFAGGTGTAEDPYQVETVSHLQVILDHMDQHFIQTADIDAGEVVAWNDGKGFEPIGRRNSFSDRDPFTGTFDGNGFVIANLIIDRPDVNAIGLFGYVENGTIKNVSLENISVNGANNVGGLTGHTRRVNIENSGASGLVMGKNNVGGLVGMFEDGLIQECFSHSEITSAHLSAGGLIGVNYYGTVLTSFSTGTVSGTQSAGGLIGYSNGGMVYGSWSSANVTGESQVGGLAGQNVFIIVTTGTGKMNHSTWSENVETDIMENSRHMPYRYVLPRNRADSDENSAGNTLNNGYSLSFGEIASSYATGQVTGNDETGGLAGVNAGRINSSYWDMETSGQNEGAGIGNSNGITGLTTDQMNGQSAYIHMYRFDFDETWQLTEGYPIPAWMEPEDAVDQPVVPVIMADPESYHFRLTALDSTKTRELVIRNTGNLELNGEISLSSAEPGIFSIIRGDGPFSLEPKSSRTVEISFRPVQDRTYESWLHISHNAPNTGSPKEINVSGTGMKEFLVQATLHRNYPNPFNRMTNIQYSFDYSIPGQDVPVQLIVYDALGRQVYELVNTMQSPGSYFTTWDASGFSSGMYIFILKIGDDVQTEQMMLVK